MRSEYQKEKLLQAESLFSQAQADATLSRYTYLQDMAKILDDLSYDLIYKDNPIPPVRRNYSSLAHDTNGSIGTGWSYSKAILEDAPFTYGKTGIPYTMDEMQEVVTRRYTTIVQNVPLQIKILGELINAENIDGNSDL